MAGRAHRSGDKLRLLHVIHTLDPAAGGAVSAARSMCAALAERGHEVTLLATGPRSREESGSYLTRIFSTEFAPMAVSTAFGKALGQARGVDLVHIHMLYRFPQAATAWFCRKNGIPYCVQPHGALEPMLYHKRERRTAKRIYEALVESRNLRHAAGLIYTAEGEKVGADFLSLPTPTFVVPLGLDFSESNFAGGDFRSRYGLADSEVILWMGRLVPVKGLELLIRAFAALAPQRPKAVLVLVGPDTENHADSLRRLIVKLGLAADRVIFTGLLQGEEKMAALKEADLFVLPSHTENFALAAIEAMAMGCPVIVSSGVKIAQDIAQAGAGRVISLCADELETAMGEILGKEEHRRSMGIAARRFAQRYDWPVVVGRLEDAYRAMIAT